MANIIKILPGQCQHLTKHDSLIEVGEDILSMDQQFEIFCYTEHKLSTLSMKLIQRISLLILLSITHVTTLTILYI